VTSQKELWPPRFSTNGLPFPPDISFFGSPHRASATCLTWRLFGREKWGLCIHVGVLGQACGASDGSSQSQLENCSLILISQLHIESGLIEPRYTLRAIALD
jgi:hypothetical protein